MNIAICDDDSGFMKNLKYEILDVVLDEMGITAVVDTYVDGNRLIKKFENGEHYDVVILDIEMPQINGKELARKLRIISSTFHLIFISSHVNEVFNVFEYDTNTFIPKTSSKDKFISEISRVVSKVTTATPNYYLFEYRDNKDELVFKKLFCKDIFYFNCINRKCYVHTGFECYELTEKSFKSFKSLSDKFIPLGFVLTCRSHIVNLEHITSIQGYDLILDNKEHLPISKRQRSVVISTVADFARKRGNKDG